MIFTVPREISTEDQTQFNYKESKKEIELTVEHVQNINNFLIFVLVMVCFQ